MGNKSGESAPATVANAATKLLKKVKREAEDDDVLETKTNLKKQKKDVIETMEGLADHLKLIGSKIDLLATKVDLLISAKGERVHVEKSLKPKAEMSSSEDESSSSDEDSEDTLATSSDSSDGEKAEEKTAKVLKNESTNVDSTNKYDEKESQGQGRFGPPSIGYVSRSGQWPFAGGRFAGGRCGGQGFCGRC